jgi:hypothetical protein
VKWSENYWFSKCLTFPSVGVFVVGCIGYMLAIVVSIKMAPHRAVPESRGPWLSREIKADLR